MAFVPQTLDNTEIDALRNLAPIPRSRIATPDGKPFAWGRVDAVHTFGRYAVVEYTQDYSSTWPIESRVNHGRKAYSAYVDDRAVGRSYHTLEEAAVGAIAYAHDGCNTQADRFFARMVGIPSAYDED